MVADIWSALFSCFGWGPFLFLSQNLFRYWCKHSDIYLLYIIYTNAVFDLWEIDRSSVLMLKWASRWAPIVLQFVILRILKSSSIPKVSLHHRLSPQAITHDQVKVKKVNAKSNWGCLNFQFSFKDPKLTLDLRLRFSLITFKEEWGVHQNIRKHECSKIMW